MSTNLNITLTAAFALALASGSFAATVNYSTRDVIVAFRAPGASDVAVNIGSVNDLLAQPNGTTVDLTSKLLLSGANALTDQFGSKLSESVGLSYSIFASGGPVSGSANGTTYAANTVWVSKARGSADLQSTPYLDVSVSTASSYRSRVEGVIGQGSTSGLIKYDAAASLSLEIIPKGDINSYSTKREATTLGSTFPTMEGSFGGKGVSYLDLYQIEGSSAAIKGNADIIGTFSLNQDGTLTYTAGGLAVTNVPEPGEYALLGIGFLVLGAVVRRSRAQN